MNEIQYHLKTNFDNFFKNIDQRFNDCMDYLKNDFKKTDEFYHAINFTKTLPQLIALEKNKILPVQILPSLEAYRELNNSINLSFSFCYKASFDSLRRALEITTFGQYSKLKNSDPDFLNKWFMGEEKTPRFKTMVDKISKDSEFLYLNKIESWKSSLNDLYGKLSKYSHTKGFEKSIIYLNKSEMLIQKFKEESLSDFLMSYIETVQQIAIFYAIKNPILIVGLPIRRKYGYIPQYNVYDFSEANSLKSLLSRQYIDLLYNLVESNIEILNKINEIIGLPDSSYYKQITDEIEQNRQLL